MNWDNVDPENCVDFMLDLLQVLEDELFEIFLVATTKVEEEEDDDGELRSKLLYEKIFYIKVL